MLADLHCHTFCSDGTYSPGQLVRAAVLCGLGLIAITDHDTVGGCALAIETVAEEKLALSVIPGIEMSIEAGNDELHLLGLNIETCNSALNAYLETLRLDRVTRIDRMIALVNQLGYPLEKADVRQAAPPEAETLGRPHLAEALVVKGYFPNQKDVFDKLLYNGGPAYLSHLKPALDDAIKLLHSAGGQVFIAHPHAVKNIKLLEKAVELGIDGIEAYHPTHTPEKVRHYLDFAQKYSLKISGGSDFHGIRGKYPPRLGCYMLSTQILDLW